MHIDLETFPACCSSESVCVCRLDCIAAGAGWQPGAGGDRPKVPGERSLGGRAL